MPDEGPYFPLLYANPTAVFYPEFAVAYRGPRTRARW